MLWRALRDNTNISIRRPKDIGRAQTTELCQAIQTVEMVSNKCNLALQVDAPLPASHMTLDALTLTLLSVSLTCLSGPDLLCLGAFLSQTASVILLLIAAYTYFLNQIHTRLCLRKTYIAFLWGISVNSSAESYRFHNSLSDGRKNVALPLRSLSLPMPLSVN